MAKQKDKAPEPREALEGRVSEAEARRAARAQIYHSEALEQDEVFLSFDLGRYQVAIPAARVREVTERREAIPLPQAPRHIRGMVQVNERVLPLADLERFFGFDSTASEEDGFERMLVVDHADEAVALLCGRVRGLVEVAKAAKTEVSVLEGSTLAPYLDAEVHAEGEVTGVLDLDALLKAMAVQ